MQVFSSGKKLSQLFIYMLEIKSHTGFQIDLRRDQRRISSSEITPLICLLFSNTEATRPPQPSHQTKVAAVTTPLYRSDGLYRFM